jgi:NAD-dependent SIR2 family protein deacetylase
MRNPAARARYWARSTIGWARVSHAAPNAGHRALAELEALGVVRGVITQNVDGLHQAAGSRGVLELHGSLARVRCTACGASQTRDALQGRLAALNPDFVAAAQAAASAPDGDAELSEASYADYRVPECADCGGVLKPDVVFFGESVPRAVVDQAWRIFEQGEVLLVVGSSLTVFSGRRFVLRAGATERPIAIVNQGPTRADPLARVRVEGRLGEALPALAQAMAALRRPTQPAAASRAPDPAIVPCRG